MKPSTPPGSLGDLLEAEHSSMMQIGFSRDKADLCYADMRRGALCVVDMARASVSSCRSAQELLLLMEVWSGLETNKRKQRPAA